jgi:hypothetical protein
MAQTNRILLLDDGELSNVARILQALGLEHTRIRGQRVVGRLAPPSELLITTSRCAQLVRRGSPPDAPSGRPVRIIGVNEDSSSMRRMLRRMGYHLLVGLPGSDDVWRPLIHRATYRGEERRQGTRVVIGSEVRISPDDAKGEPLRATLIDISLRSCQLLVPRKIEIGSALSLTLSATTTAGKPLTLNGRITRLSEDLGEAIYAATLTLDEAMAPDTRAELTGVVNLWSIGPPSAPPDTCASVRGPEPGVASLEAREFQIPVSPDDGTPQPIPVTVRKVSRS